ncbi:MAG: lipopolysaccharide biosynthesis protein, partial [Clostridia bacterium]
MAYASKMSRLAAAARMMPNGFLRHVAVVMTGTGIAQLLTFLTAPVLSRLYDPASFGILSLYTSIASILSVIISWRYEVAIVLPEKDEDAFSLLALCIQIITGMSIAILLVVVLFGESLLSRLGMSAVLPWMWWLPLHVMAMGLAQTLTYWCTRKQDFKGVASTQMVRSVAVTGTQVTGGVLQAGAGGLIGGQAGGQLITAVMLGLHVWR